MPEWPKVELRHLVAGGEISYGIVQPGQHEPGGIPIVRVADIRNGAIATAAPLRVDRQISMKYSRTSLVGGELLISLVGTVGEAAVVPSTLAGWNVARAVAVLRLNDNAAEWVRYCLLTSPTQAAISAALNTTVQATLNLSDLKRLHLPMPPRPIRDAIVDVLGALDEKIVANERALALQDLLVRAMYDNLGGEQRELGEIASQVREQADPRRLRADTAYVGLEHLPRRHMWMQNEGVADGLTSAKFRYRTGDVLFGKLRPYFHKVVTAKSSGICSTDILVVRAHNAMLNGLLLAACASDEVVTRCSSMTEGTKMPRSNWGDLSACPIRWPGSPRAEEFSARVTEVSALAVSLVNESERLARTRDELLPLLLAGTLSVATVEREVSNIV